LKILSKFYILAYISFIAPPRANQILRYHKTHNGELKRLQVGSVLLIETTLRSMMLISIAVVLEWLLGKGLYETLLLDSALGVVLVGGVLHACAYYGFFLRSMFSEKNSERLYRVVRNLCFALLPGLAILFFVNLYVLNFFAPNAVDLRLVEWYSAISTFFGAIGIIEAFVVKRAPLGVDQEISGNGSRTLN